MFISICEWQSFGTSLQLSLPCCAQAVKGSSRRVAGASSCSLEVAQCERIGGRVGKRSASHPPTTYLTTHLQASYIFRKFSRFVDRLAGDWMRLLLIEGCNFQQIIELCMIDLLVMVTQCIEMESKSHLPLPRVQSIPQSPSRYSAKFHYILTITSCFSSLECALASVPDRVFCGDSQLLYVTCSYYSLPCSICEGGSTEITKGPLLFVGFLGAEMP